MKHITLMDLRHHLGSYVDEVRIKSEPLILERSGRPVAMLCPVDYMENRNRQENHRQKALDAIEAHGRQKPRSSNLLEWLHKTRSAAI